jgi:MFS family permease
MKKEYKFLLTATILASLGSNLIGPYYAVFVQKIGGTLLDIGYTIAALRIAEGLFTMFVGKLSDRINKTLLTICGYLFFAIEGIGYLVITKPWQLYVLQVVAAVGSACLAAPLSALFARYIEKSNEGSQWGLESGGNKIAVGLAVLAGAVIVNYFGFIILFSVITAVQLVAAGIQIRLYFMERRAIAIAVT